MKNEVSLKQLEKNTSSLIFTTGLVDIEIALILLVTSLAALFDDYRYYIYFLYLIPAIFIMWAVKYIVHPRMGIVNYTKERVKKSRTFYVITTIILVGLVLLTIFGSSANLSEIINPRWIVAGIVLAICMSIAFFLNFQRMYIYALLITGTFLIIESLRDSAVQINSGFVYLGTALIVLIIGCVYLSKFIKKYPLPKTV